MTEQKRAHVVVVANAKGGCGKSTTAMHIITRLLAQNLRVGVIDLDSRQQTLSHYIQNRATFAAQKKLDLPMPDASVIDDHPASLGQQADPHLHASFTEALSEKVQRNDVVVLDGPGSDNYLVRLALGFADCLLTPLNDSFIDLDVLAQIDPDDYTMRRPGWYSELVWEQRKRRYLCDQHRIDWVVMRNRLSPTGARNKRHMQKALTSLAPRLGFRLAGGLGERVIFRELFLKGLTLSDLQAHRTGVRVTMNHVAAHQEIKALVHDLRLPRSPTQAKPLTS